MEMNFRINRKEKSGFTLIELIVVITVLAVLAAVAVPMISSYTGKASSAVCLENRGMLIRTYAIHTMTNPDDGFDTFYSTEYGAELLCPSGGEFTYDANNNSLTCSVHGDGEEGAGPDGHIDLGSGHFTFATSSWSEVIDTMPENGRVLPPGFVVYDSSGFYIIPWGEGLSQSSNLNDMINSGHAIKIVEKEIILPEGWDSPFEVKKGAVRWIDGSGSQTEGYYVWVNDTVMSDGWGLDGVKNNVDNWKKIIPGFL